VVSEVGFAPASFALKIISTAMIYSNSGIEGETKIKEIKKNSPS